MEAQLKSSLSGRPAPAATARVTGGRRMASGTSRSAWRDLVLVVGLALLTFAAGAAFELNERILSWTRPFERYQLDELPLALLVLALGMMWYGWRCWSESKIEFQRRLAAETELACRERQYRALFAGNLAGSLVASPDGRVELCNPAMARILGLSRPQAAAGRHLGAFYQDRALWDGHLQALQRGESVELDALRLDRGGSEAIVMARLMMVAHPGARAELHACFMDVTALKHAQQELFDTLAENRLLSRQNLRIQEAERRNLARELHDELGQYLNAIKIDAVTIRDNSARELPELRDRAASIVNLSSHVYRVVRDIMGRLRPVGLDELGLVAAMRHCVDGWRQRLPGTTFDFVAQRLPFALDETVTITLYRVMQECLTNVAKHAGATRVAIRLEAARGTGGVRLTVADNGRGVDGAGRGRGLGLPGMRERVEALGGSLMFDGTAGKGVTVTVSIPVACGVEHECEPE